MRYMIGVLFLYSRLYLGTVEFQGKEMEISLLSPLMSSDSSERRASGLTITPIAGTE